jgi:hypothetical protein
MEQDFASRIFDGQGIIRVLMCWTLRAPACAALSYVLEVLQKVLYVQNDFSSCSIPGVKRNLHARVCLPIRIAGRDFGDAREKRANPRARRSGASQLL